MKKFFFVAQPNGHFILESLSEMESYLRVFDPKAADRLHDFGERGEVGELIVVEPVYIVRLLKDPERGAVS